MPVVLVGIDEAGYGPTLGPLCVAMTVFASPPAPDDRVPDLWTLLERGVCREPGRGGACDRRGRIPVADSKKLKLSNAAKTVSPLVHLERGVLAFRMLLEGAGAAGVTDQSLMESLGASPPSHPCYQDDPRPLPEALTAGELAIHAALLRSCAETRGVGLLAMRCDLVWEHAFNDTVIRTGNKADTALDAVARHLRFVWDRWSSPGAFAEPTRLAIACDRLGGRAQYADALHAMLPGVKVDVVEESERRSAYVVHAGPRRAGIAFLVEAEDQHLPVALASMTAKYTRELAMRRFNRYWSQRCRDDQGREIKPTAGYSTDARRWLDEIGSVMSPDDRRQLVRIA